MYRGFHCLLRPVGVADDAALTSTAQQIIVGHVEDIKTTSSENFFVKVNANVLAIVKGTAIPGPIIFMADERNNLRVGQVYLLFMRKTGQEWNILDLYNGSIAVKLPPHIEAESSPRAKIEKIVGFTLANGSEQEILALLKRLQRSQGKLPPEVKALAQSNNANIRNEAQYTLGLRKEASSAEKLMEMAESTKDERDRQKLLSILGNSKSPSSLERFQALYKSSKSLEERRFLSEALREWKLPRSIPFLTQLLGDEDQEVKYAAMMTLQELLGKSGAEWAPSYSVFSEQPSVYLKRWQKFLDQRRKEIIAR